MHSIRFTAAALAAVLAGFLAPSAPAHAQHDAAMTRTHAAEQRNQALLQYQKDLVSILALRAEPRLLLGAALLARPLQDQPAGLSFHDLIRRAAASPGAGPAVTWMQLVDCNRQNSDCPRVEALKKLETQAPDNAAVWMLAYGQALRNDDNRAADRAMRKAAAASQYDDYAGSSLQALADAVDALPVPASARTNGQDPAITREVLAFGIGSTQPAPAFPLVAEYCRRGGQDDGIRSRCLTLAGVLVWGGNPLARSLGLHLQETLGRDADTRQKARRAQRDLTWQVAQFSRLKARAASDAKVADHLLHLARAGGTQMSIMLASLRAFGISDEAPSGWQPGQPDAH